MAVYTERVHVYTARTREDNRVHGLCTAVYKPCTRIVYTLHSLAHDRARAVYTAVYTDRVQVFTARTRPLPGRVGMGVYRW